MFHISVFLFNFCLDDLFIDVSVALKSPTIIVLLEQDYWVCEGSGYHVTWGAFGGDENSYPREGWLKENI